MKTVLAVIAALISSVFIPAAQVDSRVDNFVSGNPPQIAEWLVTDDALPLPPPSEQDIYIAQTAAGRNTGADCADAHAYTFFNTSGNWASTFTAGKISPGTTVHLCGTITGTNTANTSILNFQAAGTSGNPITLLFEPGAIVQSPACPGTKTNGCIYSAFDFTTVNGGTNGIVENMLDGSVTATNCLSGTCTIQQANTIGVNLAASNEIVENLTITHMCMHPQGVPDPGSPLFLGGCYGINIGASPGNDNEVQQNAIDNAEIGIGWAGSSNDISYNTLTFCNRCILAA